MKLNNFADIVIAVETVDTNRVTSLVANIGEVIKGAIQDLNQISASAPLTLEGADITLPALAQLVYTLLDVCFLSLFLIFFFT